MQIQIDKEGMMPINKMWRLVLRMIYDPVHSGESDLWLINNAFDKWYGKVMEHNKQLLDACGDAAFKEAVGRRGTVIDEIEYQLKLMAECLVELEKGTLEETPFKHLLSIKAVKVHGLDYRKMFPSVYPECKPDKSAYERAKEYGRINDEENKELLN